MFDMLKVKNLMAINSIKCILQLTDINTSNNESRHRL